MLAMVGEQEVGDLADIRRQSQDCVDGRGWARLDRTGGLWLRVLAGFRDSLNQKNSGLSSAYG